MKNLVACTLITIGLAAIVLPIYYMIFPALVILLFIFGCYAVGGGVELLAMSESSTGEKCLHYIEFLDENLENLTIKEFEQFDKNLKKLLRRRDLIEVYNTYYNATEEVL